MSALAAALSPHPCPLENARLFLSWIRERGGLALWRSLNLSNPTQSWTGPLMGKDGNPATKPVSFAEDKPYRVITSADDVVVCVDREVKRFRIALRMGRQGLSVKLTDHASERVRKEVAKAGPGAYHTFDFSTQEAVIMAPEGNPTPLPVWAAENNV